MDDSVFARRLTKRFVAGVITPQVRQAEPAECGIAALAIVIGYHGVHAPLETLRERAGSTLLGLSARRLIGIAREFGFVAKAFTCDIGELVEIGLPLIAYFRFNHYLVVERVGSRSVRVNDPIDGPRVIPLEDFSRGFTGVVLSVVPAAGVERRGRVFSPGRELLRRFRPAAVQLSLAASLSAAGAACFAFAAGAGGIAFDRIVAHRSAAGAIGVAAVLAAAALVLAATAERTATAAGVATARRQARWTLRRLARLPARYFMNRLPAQLASRIQSVFAFDDFAGAVAGIQLPALGVLIGALLWFDLRLGAVVTVLAACELALIIGAGLWRGGMIARVESVQLPIVGVPSMALAVPEAWRMGDGGELFGRLARRHALAMATALPAAERQAALDALRTALRAGRLVGLLVLLAATLPAGLGLGSSTALVAITIAIGAALDRFAEGFAPARMRRALHDLADLRNAALVTHAAPAGPAEPQGGRLVLADVTWAPSAAATPVIAGVSIDLPAGGVLAICGPSGSGKTVLARLVVGDLVPTAGTVTIGGVAASSSRPGTVILIDRRPPFMAASVRDNLCLGRRITDPELMDLLDAVDLAAVVAPRGGVELILLRQGQELAASERYRLAIVRALLCQPAILVLDDLLDALDPALAGRICRLLRARGVSLVATAHRLPAGLVLDNVVALRAGVRTPGA